MRSALGHELRSRLPDREEISAAELRSRYWPALREEDVFALFDLIEQELEIPAGILRPTDDLDRLLEPVSIRRPLWWWRVEPSLEDGTSELNYELKKRMRARGDQIPRGFHIRTLDELVHAWCGGKAGRRTPGN